VWVIESLVKIIDQIEMTREIGCFPRFFSLRHGFSASVWQGGAGAGKEKRVGKSSKIIADHSNNSISNCVSLDKDYLDRVTFGDLPLRDELINLFLSQVASTILKLPLLRKPDDWRFSAHSLRGAAAAIGANEIAALCTHWEEAGPPRLVAGKQDCVEALQAAEIRFRDALTTLRP
jgi:HPt (histidine-containing phosphotransfer) domain-containing protein